MSLPGGAVSASPGRPISIIVPPEMCGELPRILARLAGGERVEQYHAVRSRKDGTRVHISLTVSPVYGPGGEVAGASAIGRDVTEERRLQGQLIQTQKMEAATDPRGRGARGRPIASRRDRPAGGAPNPAGSGSLRDR